MVSEILVGKGDILIDGAGLQGGNENLVGELQIDKDTRQLWGYGSVEGGGRTDPKYVGEAGPITIYAATAMGEVDGNLLLAAKKYHAGEGYEIVWSKHTSQLNSAIPLPVTDTARSCGAVEHPDKLAI